MCVQPAAQEMELVIREPRECEFPAVRMLLPNEGPIALKRNWAERQMRGKLDRAGRTHRQAKAQLRDGKADLKWPGGRAGTK